MRKVNEDALRKHGKELERAGQDLDTVLKSLPAGHSLLAKVARNPTMIDLAVFDDTDRGNADSQRSYYSRFVSTHSSVWAVPNTAFDAVFPK